MRVLLVDDNYDVTLSLAALMRLERIDVDTAHDGFDGLESATTRHPEAVVLDIAMPGMSGFELARRLRQLPDGNNLFIVAVSGEILTPDDEATAVKAGIDRYFRKPADPLKLISLLKQRV
jgi:DNA-binding response OmpR family regulator